MLTCFSLSFCLQWRISLYSTNLVLIILFSCAVLFFAISIVRLYVQNYHKMLKPSYERFSFAAITILFIALLLTVSTSSFASGSFIIPFRPRIRFVAYWFEAKWWRSAPFSKVKFSKSRNKALQYGKILCHSYRYNMNIMTTETTTGTQR